MTFEVQSNQYVGQDPVLWSKPTQLNPDGTIAIKGEAAEQLKALIREALAERDAAVYGEAG